MPEKRFKVLATDGQRLWGVLFITQGTKGDFYAGPISPTVEFKASWHVSGSFHMRGPSLPGRGPARSASSASNFQGWFQLFNLTIHKSGIARQAVGIPYLNEALDGSVLVDLTGEHAVGIHVFLVEPHHMGLIQRLTGLYPCSPQFAIFTGTRPWLIVATYEVPTK